MDGLERVLQEDPLLRSGASPSLNAWAVVHSWGLPNAMATLLEFAAKVPTGAISASVPLRGE